MPVPAGHCLVSETARLPRLEDEGHGGGGSAGPAVGAELGGGALLTATLGIVTALLATGARLLRVARVVGRARLVLRVGLGRIVGLVGVSGALGGRGIVGVGGAGLVTIVTVVIGVLVITAAGLDGLADLVGDAQSLYTGKCQPRLFVAGSEISCADETRKKEGAGGSGAGEHTREIGRVALLSLIHIGLALGRDSGDLVLVLTLAFEVTRVATDLLGGPLDARKGALGELSPELLGGLGGHGGGEEGESGNGLHLDWNWGFQLDRMCFVGSGWGLLAQWERVWKQWVTNGGQEGGKGVMGDTLLIAAPGTQAPTEGYFVATARGQGAVDDPTRKPSSRAREIAIPYVVFTLSSFAPSMVCEWYPDPGVQVR